MMIGAKGSVFYNAGILFGLARTTCNRIMVVPSSRAPFQSEALVCIVFSALALEAFINEIGFVAQLSQPDPQPPDSVSRFGAGWERIEKTKGTTQTKFLLASEVFTGKPYEKGTQPYQDFSDLMFVRNELVHMRPRDKVFLDPDKLFISTEPPKVLGRLQNKSILADFGVDDPIASWTAWISTPAAACWACTTAVRMVQSTLHMLPESEFKERVKKIYAVHFQPIT